MNLRNSSTQQLRPITILQPLWCALAAPAFSASIATAGKKAAAAPWRRLAPCSAETHLSAPR
jgi:hypothetical protein